MAKIFIDGYRIKVDWVDSFIEGFLFLWPGDHGKVRKMPRNIYDSGTVVTSFMLLFIFLPVSWCLSHVPFIWPEYLAGMALVTCIIMGMNPCMDYFRSLSTLIICCLLLYYQVTFAATAFGFHVEKYLYYAVIIGCLFSLWRRFFNWICWCQIDRICKKYKIPLYNQKSLMDSYMGYDTHYGEKKIVYSSYQEAVSSTQSQQVNNHVCT